MMRPLILTIMIITLVSGIAAAASMTPAPSSLSSMNDCLSQCDHQYTRGRLITICDTDGITRSLNFSASYSWWDHNHCYLRCGVSALHAGQCGCPNDCFSNIGNGICADIPPLQHDTINGKKRCECRSGWTGDDCSRVFCPENDCEGHGVCISNYDDGIDRCVCDDGWTDNDCGTPRVRLPSLPFGSAFNGDAYQIDAFGDNHPLFNISSITDVTITVNDDDLLRLLSPVNLRNDSYYIIGNMSIFGSGSPSFHQSVNNIGLRLAAHGPDSLRFMLKKSFEVRFDMHDYEHAYYGLGGLTFKSGSNDMIVKNQLYNEMARASLVAAPRSSFAWLTINKISWGIYCMAESVDAQFAHSRFSTPWPSPLTPDHDRSGVYHGREGFLEYRADGLYRDVLVEDSLNVGVHQYVQDTGPHEWDDIITFIKLLNETDIIIDQQQLLDSFDIPLFLRTVMLESFFINQHGWIIDASSYSLFHDNFKNAWHMVLHHVDDYLQTLFIDDRNVWHYIAKRIEQSPLNKLVLGNQEFNTTLLINYHQFITNVFGNGTVRIHVHPADRFARLAGLLTTSIEQDILWQYSSGVYPNDFTVAVAATRRALMSRVDEVKQQLPPVPSSSSSGVSEWAIIGGIGAVIAVLAICYFCWRRHWSQMADEALLEPSTKMGDYHSVHNRHDRHAQSAD